MKGLELPINVIIILIIGLIVLLAIFAFFSGVWNPGTQGISLETAKQSACQKLVSLNCAFSPRDITINNYDADEDGKLDPGNGFDVNVDDNNKDNLMTLCYKKFGITQETPCKQICNCQT